VVLSNLVQKLNEVNFETDGRRLMERNQFG